MGVNWDKPKLNRYLTFKRQLTKLARQHGTSTKALARVFSDINTGHNWRALYSWVESPEFFRKAAE